MVNRLLLVVDSAVIGGVTRIVVNLAHGLSARNWEVRTIFPAWADDEFIAWCRRGPPSAEVEDVKVRWSEPRGEFRTFRVTR